MWDTSSQRPRHIKCLEFTSQILLIKTEIVKLSGCGIEKVNRRIIIGDKNIHIINIAFETTN